MVLKKSANVEECGEKLDNVMKQWTHLDGKHRTQKVCFCCDIIMFEENSSFVSFEKLKKLKNLFHDVENANKANTEVVNHCKFRPRFYQQLMKDMIVSPNTCVIDNQGVVCCENCKKSLHHQKCPEFGTKMDS